jgi:hypothetical protein
VAVTDVPVVALEAGVVGPTESLAIVSGCGARCRVPRAEETVTDDAISPASGVARVDLGTAAAAFAVPGCESRTTDAATGSVVATGVDDCWCTLAKAARLSFDRKRSAISAPSATTTMIAPPATQNATDRLGERLGGAGKNASGEGVFFRSGAPARSLRSRCASLSASLIRLIASTTRGNRQATRA